MYIVALNALHIHLRANVIPVLVFVMWTLTGKTLWDRIAALAEPVFLEMDIPAKVRKKLYQKTYSSHEAIVVARCYFSELSSTMTSLDLKLFRVKNLFFD